jgi:uncharacterized protein YqeY
MSLKDRISEDMKAAMRAKDAARLSAVRLLLAALKQKEVDERIELADADVLGVIEKMLKQRRESIAQYEKAARADLAAQESFEIGVLQAYLPAQMGEAEIAQAVAAAVAESGAAGVKDMGKVMALLKARLAGKADMGKVSALVKAKLS